MTEHKPISTFDEICHLTIETMCRMDLETLLQLKKQATRELDRAKLTKGHIDLALLHRRAELDKAENQPEENQQTLFDNGDVA